MMGYVHYDFGLVIGSIVIAVVVCYFSISIEKLLFKNFHEKLETVTLWASGATLGAAIWCMHFIGMLACHFPAPYFFDYYLTILSYIIAMLASTFAFWVNRQSSLSLLRLILGSILMGLGISGMHYTGMIGLSVQDYKSYYDPLLVFLSIMIAISGSGLAFWLNFKYKNTLQYRELPKIGIAFMMALAIIGMHYTGMSAVSWQALDSTIHADIYASEQGILLFSVIFVTSLVLMAAFSVAVMDQRLEQKGKQVFHLNQELAHRAFQDGLTQLPNRSFLTEYAEHLFIHHKYNQYKMAFLYLDLDQFKTVNDGFGHHVGDELLRQMTARVQDKMSSTERLLRIGGDEFLLVVEHATLEKAVGLAEKIRQIIQESFLIDQKEINISGSIGIAMFPEHGENLQDLLMNADAAMRSSKKQGRNTYSIYNENLGQQEVKNQSKLINDLYKAVEEKQFILFYQPKFTAKDQTICGVEALIRWNHPVLGLLGPNMFIRGAEQTGLIIQIGYWVIEEALQQIQRWDKKGLNFFPIAVNLSAMQFEHKHLFANLQQLFQQYPVNPQHLILEVTETIAMHNIESSIQNLERLRQMGIQLAIDDFGTGHSSFLYLKNLPVDELKIDRGFILDLTPNSKDEMILESIIQLAVRLGLTVTVEGVEHQEQADLLTRLGCQQLQGYLLGMPVPVEKLEELQSCKLRS